MDSIQKMVLARETEANGGKRKKCQGYKSLGIHFLGTQGHTCLPPSFLRQILFFLPAGRSQNGHSNMTLMSSDQRVTGNPLGPIRLVTLDSGCQKFPSTFPTDELSAPERLAFFDLIGEIPTDPISSLAQNIISLLCAPVSS